MVIPTTADEVFTRRVTTRLVTDRVSAEHAPIGGGSPHLCCALLKQGSFIPNLRPMPSIKSPAAEMKTSV